MKYIDAEELKVELDRQKIGYNVDGKHSAEYDTCVKVLRIIDSLQQGQPEVNLEKEIKEWVDLMVGASFPEQDGDFISEEDYRSVIRQTAIHFLGLNARKEE